ncbi:MAG: hypothetical protein Q8M83_03140 [bacterium]|nr:hypothetical protein [bacterium]
MKTKIKILSAFLLNFFLFVFPILARAEEQQTSVALPNPLGTTYVPAIIGNIIMIFMGMAGSVALMMFIYGGALWLTSGGNSEKITKGRDIMIWTTAGLVVMFSAYIVTKFVIGALLGTGTYK